MDGWMDGLISYVQDRPGKSGQKKTPTFTNSVLDVKVGLSRLRPHRLCELPHHLPVKRIRRADGVRVLLARTRARVDVQARPVHAAPDRLRAAAREHVALVVGHGGAHVEVVAVHAEFFEDAGFAGGEAGGVVVLEPLEAVGGAGCGAGFLGMGG